ncbi:MULTISPECIES: fatty acid desaturase [unclassified Thermosynechococcus]|uniref:acyl-CoA desaturase n=1 Tax=unclassified Thermosynechococcus TaxID=2622553 RepID=UPI0019819868|nr:MULTISPECIES: fatty acid desaturase [unclassified Thermosynechococcus]MDR5639570.1 fatty acid desaturase [Thermosynechococcus sp. PP42]MDR7921756.1 fatty acid desaturase [Thermosynechococcus sp. HY213]QSF50454.1 fatty acid desaturase [Thermosynechococcus sp. TA-1]WNC31074.1 fatty acid desaturase [Thermosynechococcus sp. PKX82]WNC33610.1 fatty acid desaturase [Thermosynechococcus sp. PKX95]
MTQATVAKPPIAWPTATFIIFVHLGALLAFLPGMFSWKAVLLALVLHWLTAGIGITLGWHRLVTHRSFQVPKWLEYFLVFCGTLSMQGGPIWWVGLHRHHHLYSDQPNDHHDSRKGFWWSHIEWMFREVPAEAEIPRFTKDIADDPVYQFLDKYFLPIQVVLAIVLYLWGGWPFVVWGIFVRLVTVYHTTWLVNSATHAFGYRTFETTDHSTNCWWVALLTFGEGWHNNHHAYQYSARHGLQWWELDLTWLTIRLLQLLGLATKVRLVEAPAASSQE